MTKSEAPSSPNAARPSRTRFRFQFSLFRLMMVVTVVALLLGLTASIQGLVPMLIVSLVWCVMPTPFIIGAIFGRGDIRAFAIGGLVPWLLILREPPGLSLSTPIWLLIMPVICGVVAVATFRWLKTFG
jgi:hypothetical protein